MNEKLILWRDRKKELQLTNQKLAEIAKLPLRTVEQVMCGKVENPRLDTVQAIERALGLDGARWTEEDKAQGVQSTITRKLTAEEDDAIALYREIGQKKGASAQALAIKLLEQILNN